jgi:hypothetical protein
MNTQIVTWTEEFEVNSVRLRASECGLIERFVERYNKWYIAKCNPSKNGYIVCRLNKKLYKFHRLIYKGHNIDWDINDTKRDNSIDHVDRNPSNNTIKNLRIATNSENGCNKTKQKNNESGETNIYVNYRKKCDFWEFRIKVNKQGMKTKNKSMKMGDGLIPEDWKDRKKYPIPQKLIDLRDQWISELHGSFAQLN